MEKEIIKTTAAELAMGNEELSDMFGESTIDTNTNLHFQNIPIIREAAQFEVADNEYAKTITGHILFKHRANQWWIKPMEEQADGESTMPNCYSIDGIKSSGGDDIQSQFCAECPHDKFGSARKGSGKACKNTIRFLVLPDKAVMPVIVSAPPTSIGKKSSVQRWLNSIPNQVSEAYEELGIRTKLGGPIVDYWPARVEFSLEKSKVANDMTVSVLRIRTLEVTTPDTQAGAARLKQLFSLRKDMIELYDQEIISHIETENQATAAEQSEPPVSYNMTPQVGDEIDSDDPMFDDIPL